MFGFLKGGRQPPFHPDRALDNALHEHTRHYFTKSALADLRPEARQSFADDLRARIETVQRSTNLRGDLREMLSEYIIMYARVGVLALTESEKAVMEYGRNPYITGTLHHHIRAAAAHHEELSPLLERTFTDSDLISFANLRGAIYLYYANALNAVRIHYGDWIEDGDWFRPYVEAMLVREEGWFREQLGLPQVAPGEFHTLPYHLFMEVVLAGEPDPFGYWARKCPQLPLAGLGPY